MKICVIGNSQVACIKSAWDNPDIRPSHHELTFFATFGLRIAKVELAGKRLVPTNASLKQDFMHTAGLGEIDIPDYDVFLIVGAGLGFLPVDARTSRQVMRALCSDLLKDSPAYSIASKLRQVADAPIYIMPAPLSDERSESKLPSKPYTHYGDYFPLLVQAMDIPGVQVLKQPEETITRGRFTKYEFSKDAIRLATSAKTEGLKQEEDDHRHMNVAYGTVRLKDFFARLPSSGPTSRANTPQ